MTPNAQLDTLIGALCSDRSLREAVLASATREAALEHIARYASQNGVSLEPGVVGGPIWDLIQNPDTKVFFSPLDCLRLFCRVWPCR